MFYIIAILIIVVQARAIAYMAWDKDYGCLTRAALNMVYPILKALGYTFITGDVDKFKQLNTNYGHGEVNRMVWRAVRGFFQCCRMGDIVFRLYSGDEFLIATKSKHVDAMLANITTSFASQGMCITLAVVTGDIDVSMLKIIQSKKG